jgi:hypothetical protein
VFTTLASSPHSLLDAVEVEAPVCIFVEQIWKDGPTILCYTSRVQGVLGHRNKDAIVAVSDYRVEHQLHRLSTTIGDKDIVDRSWRCWLISESDEVRNLLPNAQMPT